MSFIYLYICYYGKYYSNVNRVERKKNIPNIHIYSYKMLHFFFLLIKNTLKVR